MGSKLVRMRTSASGGLKLNVEPQRNELTSARLRWMIEIDVEYGIAHCTSIPNLLVTPKLATSKLVLCRQAAAYPRLAGRCTN